MARFLDGPAAGTELLLRSCPVMLRVTIAEEGLPGIGEVKVDALDQPDDELDFGERIEVYRGVPGTHSVAFLDSRRRGGVQGRYEFADYRHVPLGPDVLAELEDREAWVRWVHGYLRCRCGHTRAQHPAGGACALLVGPGCDCDEFELAELSAAG